MSFTKGPWEMVYAGHGSDAHPAEVRGQYLRIIVDHREDFGDPEADARLIAAAPDLFETVRWMAQTIHQAYHSDHPGTFETCGKNTCDAATQALKKARGEP